MGQCYGADVEILGLEIEENGAWRLGILHAVIIVNLLKIYRGRYFPHTRPILRVVNGDGGVTEGRAPGFGLQTIASNAGHIMHLGAEIGERIAKIGDAGCSSCGAIIEHSGCGDWEEG